MKIYIALVLIALTCGQTWNRPAVTTRRPTTGAVTTAPHHAVGNIASHLNRAPIHTAAPTWGWPHAQPHWGAPAHIVPAPATTDDDDTEEDDEDTEVTITNNNAEPEKPEPVPHYELEWYNPYSGELSETQPRPTWNPHTPYGYNHWGQPAWNQPAFPVIVEEFE